MTQVCPVCNNVLADGIAVCPSCGFKLLGSTEKFDPVSNGVLSPEADHAGERRAELRIVRGPQTGITIALHEGTVTMGRDPQCDIFLNDMTVSRKHATIESSERGCVICDTNSYNGVWVNDKAVDKCLLQSGDLVQIGAFCLAYRERVVNKA